MINIRKIEQDKLLHFIANCAIDAVVTILCAIFLNPFIAMGIGFVVSMIVAWGKEYFYDKKMGHGVYNKKDILYGLYGSICETISILLLIIVI